MGVGGDSVLCVFAAATGKFNIAEIASWMGAMLSFLVRVLDTTNALEEGNGTINACVGSEEICCFAITVNLRSSSMHINLVSVKRHASSMFCSSNEAGGFLAWQ